MSRSLQITNMIGTAALAVLCVAQWQANRKLNLQLNEVEKSRIATVSELDRASKTLKGAQADLEDFRGQIARGRVSLQEAEGALSTNRIKLDHALNENEQLKNNLTNWMEAVSLRDEQIKTVQEKLAELATERNQVVEKFNQVVQSHNKLASDLEQRAKDYNALVEKYNALAKEK